jgi:hypothetical protein
VVAVLEVSPPVPVVAVLEVSPPVPVVAVLEVSPPVSGVAAAPPQAASASVSASASPLSRVRRRIDLFLSFSLIEESAIRFFRRKLLAIGVPCQAYKYSANHYFWLGACLTPLVYCSPNAYVAYPCHAGVTQPRNSTPAIP